MEVAVTILESYRGRDKVMRTACFAAMWAAGVTENKNPALSQKLQVVVGRLGAARTVLRLFDDLPMLAHSLTYGLGKQEKDGVTRWLNVVKNVCDQCFFPIEHIAWAGDAKALDVKSPAAWSVLSVMVWAMSLAIGSIVSVRKMSLLMEKRKNLIEELKSAKLREDSSEALQAVQEALYKLKIEDKFLKLDLISNLTNLACAVSWFPPGMLWSGKLSMSMVGFFGTVASVIGLHRSYGVAKEYIRQKRA